MLFSIITKDIKRKILKRACFFAFPGTLLILYMGVFLSISELEKWGWIGFALGFSLIAAGMIPLRRVTFLESKPHELLIDEEGIHFTHARKGNVLVPHSSVEKVSFISKRFVYGIRLYLKGNRMQFLPFFSRRAYDVMQMDEAD